MIVLAGSLLAVVYVWRLIEPIYFAEPPKEKMTIEKAPGMMVVSTWLLAGACIVFGLSTDFTVGTAQDAARVLLGGAR